MINLEVAQGAQKDYVLQVRNTDGSNPVSGDFLDTDALSATVWAGQSQTSLFAPTVIWYTADSTQTGYDEGQVQITVSPTESATLDAAGVYQLQVFVTRSEVPGCVAWVTLTCLPAAGTDTQLITTYCDDSDLLFYAPWIQDLLQSMSDQEGFYPQRLRARKWLDRIVVSRARPLAYIFNIMTPLTPWGPIEAPNYVIQGYLEANYLLIRDNVVELTARRAISDICEKQISVEPSNNAWPARWRHFRSTANNLLATYRAELNISSAPTVSVTDPTGTGGGAQALAMINGTGGVQQISVQQFGAGYVDVDVNVYNGTGTGCTATGTIVNGEVTAYTITAAGTGFFQKQTPDVAFNLGMISWR